MIACSQCAACQGKHIMCRPLTSPVNLQGEDGGKGGRCAGGRPERGGHDRVAAASPHCAVHGCAPPTLQSGRHSLLEGSQLGRQVLLFVGKLRCWPDTRTAVLTRMPCSMWPAWADRRRRAARCMYGPAAHHHGVLPARQPVRRPEAGVGDVGELSWPCLPCARPLSFGLSAVVPLVTL